MSSWFTVPHWKRLLAHQPLTPEQSTRNGSMTHAYFSNREKEMHKDRTTQTGKQLDLQTALPGKALRPIPAVKAPDPGKGNQNSKGNQGYKGHSTSTTTSEPRRGDGPLTKPPCRGGCSDPPQSSGHSRSVHSRRQSTRKTTATRMGKIDQPGGRGKQLLRLVLRPSPASLGKDSWNGNRLPPFVLPA